MNDRSQNTKPNGNNTVRNKTLHIVEFEHLQDGECARLLKWCTTCCFQHWNTHYKQGIMQFHFQDRFDAERFIMAHASRYLPQGPERWDDDKGMTWVLCKNLPYTQLELDSTAHTQHTTHKQRSEVLENTENFVLCVDADGYIVN
jgi:hypothetical protein